MKGALGDLGAFRGKGTKALAVLDTRHGFWESTGSMGVRLTHEPSAREVVSGASHNAGKRRHPDPTGNAGK